MSNNAKEQAKVDFLKVNLSGIENLDPYSHIAIDQTKKILYDNGFYKLCGWHYISDTAVTNFILRAQGKDSTYRRPRGKTKPSEPVIHGCTIGA